MKFLLIIFLRDSLGAMLRAAVIPIRGQFYYIKKLFDPKKKMERKLKMTYLEDFKNLFISWKSFSAYKAIPTKTNFTWKVRNFIIWEKRENVPICAANFDQISFQDPTLCVFRICIYLAMNINLFCRFETSIELILMVVEEAMEKLCNRRYIRY